MHQTGRRGARQESDFDLCPGHGYLVSLRGAPKTGTTWLEVIVVTLVSCPRLLTHKNCAHLVGTPVACLQTSRRAPFICQLTASFSSSPLHRLAGSARTRGGALAVLELDREPGTSREEPSPLPLGPGFPRLPGFPESPGTQSRPCAVLAFTMDEKHHPPHAGSQRPAGLQPHPVVLAFASCANATASAARGGRRESDNGGGGGGGGGSSGGGAGSVPAAELLRCLPRSWAQHAAPTATVAASAVTPRYLVIVRCPVRVAVSAAHFYAPNGEATRASVAAFVGERLPVVTAWQALWFTLHAPHPFPAAAAAAAVTAAAATAVAARALSPHGGRSLVVVYEALLGDPIASYGKKKQQLPRS